MPSQEPTNLSKQNPNSRDSAIDLLRIIAMFFIVAHHFAVHSGFDFSGFEPSGLIWVNQLWVEFLASLGKLGVTLFVLISGYYLSARNRFKTGKLIYVIVTMFVFSLILGLIYIVFDQPEITPYLIRLTFFPNGMRLWWFMTFYLLLYFLSPFLNRLIVSMGKKLHLFLIVVLILLWSVLPTLIGVGYGATELGLFSALYLISAYIRKYEVVFKLRASVGILCACGVFFLCFGLHTAISRIPVENPLIDQIASWFALGLFDFGQICIAVILFLSFRNLCMHPCKWLGLMGGSTLLIYLLHDHHFIRNVLWIRWLRIAEKAAAPWFIPYSIGIILGVYFGFMALALAYQYSLGLLIKKAIGFFDKKWLHRLDELINQDTKPDETNIT